MLTILMSLTEKLRESLYKEIFMKLTVAIFLYFRLILEGHDLDKKDDVEFTPKELAKILKKEWLLPLFERKVNGRFFLVKILQILHLL